ncbi:FAD-dependent monooxygenase [Rhodoligotrophos defluvii]|uniref:FAD-dependent monooxygenase n=1 Tax=Rhodoligotrophos defluvii TaxID=2561934 RepID=UPI0010C98453|nr:FAD-dependent monooxygenase [Rhodoligotrophos defluvii]
MTSGRYDAIIVGGGFVGMTMAVALAGRQARSPMHVAVIDSRSRAAAAPGPEATIDDDGRAFAITSTSRRMLSALGLWSELAEKAQPVSRIEVSDGRLDGPAGRVLLRFDEDGREASASIIESRFLYRAFAEAVAASPEVTWLSREITEIDAQGPAAHIRLADGDALVAPLVIAADGRDSPTRSRAGIGTIGWPYGQYGMVTTIAHTRPHQGVAVEHFLPAGPFAILPLPGNEASLVWTETEAEAKRLLSLDESGFTAELMRRCGDRLGPVRVIGPRRGYPLSLQLARTYVAARLALVGDAAHVLHPIAGLGFNLGLRDIAALSQTVIDAARLGLDVGAPDVLQRYQQWRRYDATKVALVTDGLNRLFSNDNPVLRLLRDFGLAAVDKARPLKGFFMQQAAGEESGLPRLMAGEPL